MRMRYFVLLVVPLLLVAAHVDAQTAAPAATSQDAQVPASPSDAPASSDAGKGDLTIAGGKRAGSKVTRPWLEKAKVTEGAALKQDRKGCLDIPQFSVCQ